MMRIFLAAAILTSIASCSIVNTASKTAFTDDYYTLKKDTLKEKVYVDFEDDAITIYSLTKHRKTAVLIDSTVPVRLFPKEQGPTVFPDLKFGHNNFDLDLFTMPVKLRPAVKDIPNQLNANINGAIYAGFRHDQFNLHYHPNPLGKFRRSINHVGISGGLFTGIGNTFMSPTNTNFHIATEYDGVVWIKGFALIAALNNFTAGLAVGTDNLADKNKSHWIYEGKPWLGLVLGLNLN